MSAPHSRCVLLSFIAVGTFFGLHLSSCFGCTFDPFALALSKLLLAGLLVRDCIVSRVVIDTLVACRSSYDRGAPFSLLEPDTTRRCEALLAESSGATSLDSGLSLVPGREVGPFRRKDEDGTRSWWAAERALAGFDILCSHTSPWMFLCQEQTG